METNTSKSINSFEDNALQSQVRTSQAAEVESVDQSPSTVKTYNRAKALIFMNGYCLFN